MVLIPPFFDLLAYRHWEIVFGNPYIMPNPVEFPSKQNRVLPSCLGALDHDCMQYTVLPGDPKDVLEAPDVECFQLTRDGGRGVHASVPYRVGIQTTRSTFTFGDNFKLFFSKTHEHSLPSEE